MTRMPDEHHGATFVGVTLDLEVDLGDERAGRIDYAQAAILGAIPFAGGNAMRTENHALALGHFVEALDENRAFLFERFQHKSVMHYLMTHVERASVGAQRAAHRFHRAIDTGAKPARLGEYNFFNHSLA
jgi:hypothetical protein